MAQEDSQQDHHNNKAKVAKELTPGLRPSSLLSFSNAEAEDDNDYKMPAKEL